MLREHQTYLLAGAAVREADKKVYNSVILLSPAGEKLGAYSKMHLVPFGEYVPFSSALPNFIQFETFAPGKSINLLPLAEVKNAKVGIAICFESVFPNHFRKFVAKGADIMGILTNDAWFCRHNGACPTPIRGALPCGGKPYLRFPLRQRRNLLHNRSVREDSKSNYHPDPARWLSGRRRSCQKSSEHREDVLHPLRGLVSNSLFVGKPGTYRSSQPKADSLETQSRHLKHHWIPHTHVGAIPRSWASQFET